MLITSSDNNLPYYKGHKYDSIFDLHEKEKMHGAKRVLVFCLMTAVLPTILTIIPLYLRHVVFADVVTPVAESDILSLQEGISSIFCKSLSLKMNSTFNAFQLQGKPTKSEKLKHIRLKKSMTLPDDTLEYWGFYLLKGSVVQLKVCSRYDGGRILVVRGEKNLDTCNLMKHERYGARMDAEFIGVKVYEETESILDSENSAKEIETTDTKPTIDASIKKSKHKKHINYNNTNIRHHHKKHTEDLEALKKSLENNPSNLLDRLKRSISPLDSHIKHGGNAMNLTQLDDGVSSFETNLLTCYDGKILLSRSFQPSKVCNSIAYLYQSNHIFTEHSVASDGYYYYIFYSDNDFVRNDIHAVFDIYKPTYGYRNSDSVRECVNRTSCRFPLDLIGDETVIVEVPTRDGIEHEDDDITLLTSTCHPRTEVYVVFPVLVLVLIMGCAFL
ncbi:unnamed protein product [Phyllotreta striolata]|uniref:E3 ubiquitin-protein ligase APD1-4 middle domain-containing protein n=1 Tax=Phyllotreta striolata TaxID=444603 RepID=A0A9N9TSS7_PHYSR|nr:unnamed protein product [Phyllotreta striolata]